jgi:hypothetical protein
MKKLILLILQTLFVCLTAFAQNVEVLGDAKLNLPKNKTEEFYFLNTEIDTTQLTYIAHLKASRLNTKDAGIDLLFLTLKNEAQARGANAFRLVDWQINSPQFDKNYLTIAIYQANPLMLEQNQQFFPKNMIYVFGNIDSPQSKPKKVALNGQKIAIEPMKYLAYQNKIDEEATLSVGGITGMKFWIKGKEGRLPNFYSLSGFGVGPGMGNVGTIGLSFNTGRIYPVDIDFGSILIKVLKEQKL